MQDHSHPELRPAPWTALRAVIALILEGSTDGNFSQQLQGYRALAGTGLQLAGVIALGRLRTRQTGWRRASLQVLQAGGRCQGFTLLTWLEEPGAAGGLVQISLFKVAGSAQARGLGMHMLSSLLAQLPPGCTVQADCLPASVGMQRLLQRQGFSRGKAERQGLQRWLCTRRPLRGSGAGCRG